MRKIAVIGNGGGGKTTLSKRLGASYGLPVYHVDSVQFLDGFKIRPVAETSTILSEQAAGDKWIIDGFGTMEVMERRFALADRVVFVDFPLWRHYFWATRRQIQSLRTPRAELPPNCREATLSRTLELYRILWRVHQKIRPRLLAMFEQESLKAKVVRITTPAEWETVASGGVLGAGGGAWIQLTPLTRADAAEMFPVLSAPEIYQYINQGGPGTVEELQARYARQEKGLSPDGTELWFNWIVRDAGSQNALGFVQATVKKGSTVALIGFALNPCYWGQGFAREAVGAMLAQLRVQGIKTFHASIDPRNSASLKLLARLGFKKSSITSSVPGDVLLELS